MSMMSDIFRAILSIGHIRTVETYRNFVNHIYVDGRSVRYTNGHVLVLLQLVAELPRVALPKAAAAWADRTIRGIKGAEAFLRRAGDVETRLVVVDGDGIEVASAPCVAFEAATEFPDISDVESEVAASPVIGRIAMEARYLEAIARLRITNATDVAGGSALPITFDVRGPKDPVTAEWTDAERNTTRVLVMPVRID